MITKEPVKTWRIWCTLHEELPILYINARSFDQALEIARRYDPRYETGQVNDTYIKNANHYFKGDNKFVDTVLKLHELERG